MSPHPLAATATLNAAPAHTARKLRMTPLPATPDLKLTHHLNRRHTAVPPAGPLGGDIRRGRARPWADRAAPEAAEPAAAEIRADGGRRVSATGSSRPSPGASRPGSG